MLELGHANSARLKNNLDHIDSNPFEFNQLKGQVSHLNEEAQI